ECQRAAFRGPSLGPGGASGEPGGFRFPIYRRGTTWLRSGGELELDVAQLDHIPIAQPSRHHHRLAIDAGAVSAVEVGHPPPIVGPGDLQMLAGDEGVVNLDRRPRMAPDDRDRLEFEPHTGPQR